jgi:hypothetical protein
LQLYVFKIHFALSGRLRQRKKSGMPNFNKVMLVNGKIRGKRKSGELDKITAPYLK